MQAAKNPKIILPRDKIYWDNKTHITENCINCDRGDLQYVYSVKFFDCAKEFSVHAGEDFHWSDYLYYIKLSIVKSYEFFRLRRPEWEQKQQIRD